MTLDPKDVALAISAIGNAVQIVLGWRKQRGDALDSAMKAVQGLLDPMNDRLAAQDKEITSLKAQVIVLNRRIETLESDLLAAYEEREQAVARAVAAEAEALALRKKYGLAGEKP